MEQPSPEIDRFLELVEHVCQRPATYVGDESFDSVCALFLGYSLGAPDSPIGGEGWRALNSYVCAHLRFPDKYVCSHAIRQCSRDDREAISKLGEFLKEFALKKKLESPSDIAKEAIARAKAAEEGAPETTWRKFSRALFRGEKDVIENLIQPHPNASVLWALAFPENVAQMLDKIEENQVISRIPGTGDETHAVIITPGFGPISLRLDDGNWKIDATKVIEQWNGRREGGSGHHKIEGKT